MCTLDRGLPQQATGGHALARQRPAGHIAAAIIAVYLPHSPRNGQAWQVKLAVTEIGWDGGLRRGIIDTARRSDTRRWEELIGRVPAYPPPYRAGPGSTVYYISVDDHVILVSEHDLEGPLRDLVVAVLSSGAIG